MTEAIFQAISRMLDAAAGVIGVPLWIVGREDYTRAHREACPQGVAVPATLAEPGLIRCRCGTSVLLVPVCAEDASRLVVRSGHLPGDFPWAHGTLKVPNLGNPSLEWTVPALPVTAALLSTIASSMDAIGIGAPGCLLEATDDIAKENVRRISVSLAANLEPRLPALSITAAHSLSRVPPIKQFINRVFRNGQSLASFFEDLTRDLPVGFGLLDLAAMSLVRQHDFCEICVQIRKKNPLQCVLSDLTQIWRAVLCRSCPTLWKDLYTYRCPFHFTEAFFPVFAGELAVGAVFGGQLVQTSKQREQIVSAAVPNMDPGAASKISALGEAVRLSSYESVQVVQSACRGLAGLTGATFREWCRAETHSGFREGLTESASSDSNVQKLAEHVCPLVGRYLDVTSCSVWLLEDDRVILAATTAPKLFVRSHPGAPTKATRSAELIGLAYYKLGEGLTGLVAQTREPMRTENATREPGWWGKYSETPADSRFVAVPLLRYQKLLGVLRASKHSDQSPIADEDFELLEHFAGEVSIAIHEKRLKEELEARAEGFRLALVETGHEFRTPLQNILGYVSILNSRLSDNPQLQQIGKSIEEESDRAKRQMENSILFGRNILFHPRRARLGDLFEPCALQYERRAAERNIRIIVYDSAKRLPEIEMDSDRMMQVITNLFDNAVKWSFQGELIHVRGEHSDKEVKFSVQDRGTGIPPKFHKAVFEHLFERRVVEDIKRFVTGTGIGLKIVKRIIQAHHGEIKVSSAPFVTDLAKQSPQDGHTVTFTVTLPKSQKGN